MEQVFARFHNLNLLALLEDLRSGRVAQGAWRIHGLLCPISHGLPTGEHVHEVIIWAQVGDLGHGCDYAAQLLGADSESVLRFVQRWDADPNGAPWLVKQLEHLWRERLADADTMQQLLCGTDTPTPGT